ncbi:MAG: cupin domain-containing protein [Bacteroidales bacterium]|nr:cupin domain-containing protein [Bacteroidales bacterium]MCF8404667.1 cupin domain-containing protein [Bacteroidales bacterium]
MQSKTNIFEVKELPTNEQEVISSLLSTEDLEIQRIVTLKPFEKPGIWYNQDKDEWVILLKGKAELEWEQGETIHLYAGDYIFIPAHKIHRIKRSGKDEICVWLAIHGNLK